jgi:hypothetical protein
MSLMPERMQIIGHLQRNREEDLIIE